MQTVFTDGKCIRASVSLTVGTPLIQDSRETALRSFATALQKVIRIAEKGLFFQTNTIYERGFQNDSK